MKKQWTKDGNVLNRDDGNMVTLHGPTYSPDYVGTGLDLLLADANRGAEAEQIETAMLALKKAVEEHRDGVNSYWSRTGGDNVFGNDNHQGARVNGEHRGILDALKLCPAVEDDEQNARIVAAEQHIKDAEAKLVDVNSELASAKEDLKAARK